MLFAQIARVLGDPGICAIMVCLHNTFMVNFKEKFHSISNSVFRFFNFNVRGSKDFVVDIFFGPPGVGKTTCAAHFARKYLKHDIPVYSNVPILGTFILDPRTDLGFFDIRECVVILDEASIEFNNRKMDMPKNVITFLKLHRHAKCRVLVFSQSWNDMDITLRRLAINYFLITRSILPGRICCRRIKKSIGIDENTHEPADFYRFALLSRKLIAARPAWKMFDSWEMPAYPSKEFKRW